MEYYVVSDNSLSSVADAIRTKSGNNQPLAFPDEFIYEINNLSQSGHEGVFVDTTANWNSQVTYVPPAGAIIIYTDKAVVDNKNVPGIKIGDGNAYCVDLPFVADEIAQTITSHIQDNIRHITSQERIFWNNKLNVSVNGEELQFNRN